MALHIWVGVDGCVICARGVLSFVGGFRFHTKRNASSTDGKEKGKSGLDTSHYINIFVWVVE